jgi:hypothetical protein
MKPLQPGLLRPSRRAWFCAGGEIECGADADDNGRCDLDPVAQHPEFLFRRTKSAPDDIRRRRANRVDRRLEVDLVQISVRRGEAAHDFGARTRLQQALSHAHENLRRRPEQKVRKAGLLAEFEDSHHQIHPGNARRVRDACAALEPGDRPAVGEHCPCTFERFAEASVALSEHKQVYVAKTHISPPARKRHFDDREGRRIHIACQAGRVHDGHEPKAFGA